MDKAANMLKVPHYKTVAGDKFRKRLGRNSHGESER